MNDYTSENNKQLITKLRTLQNELPEFCKLFFRAKADTTQIKTRIAYAYDLRIFFYFLYTEIDTFKLRKSKNDFTVEDLDLISATDLNIYSEFLNLYSIPDLNNPDVVKTFTNDENGKKRKLSTVRSFYKFFYQKEMIKTNPALLIEMPKIHEKPIVRMDVNEVADLLDKIENGEKLTAKQAAYHKKTALRDLAMISLFLGTGIRISECVGLDINDFNFKDNSFIVTRKGGNRTILYYSDEVKEAILNYLENDRKNVDAVRSEDANALFLSMQKKRITPRAVENILDKYIKIAVPLKKITPHKLRSTFGTNLYKETNDIYLVADVLGHKDVNTTRRHYAAIEQDRRRLAAKVTKLRED